MPAFNEEASPPLEQAGGHICLFPGWGVPYGLSTSDLLDNRAAAPAPQASAPAAAAPPFLPPPGVVARSDGEKAKDEEAGMAGESASPRIFLLLL